MIFRLHQLPLVLLVLAILPYHPTTAHDSSLTYNEIQQKNSHNSYERLEGVLDQMLYHHLRGIEIDAHLGFLPGTFDVYHDAGYFQSYSSFNRLVDGVKLLQEFHEIVPNHQVVTIFMDLKGGLGGPDHTVEDYDAIISQLPLYTPADAQGNASSIQEGIDLYGWPQIETMRGKFIWILTHGQDDYCQTDLECGQQQAFVSQSVLNNTGIGQKSYSVFYNQNLAKEVLSDDVVPIGQAIYNEGYIGRVYHSDDIDTPEKWALATSHNYQHIATDQVNYHSDPFSRTHNRHGYPFQTLNGVDVSDWRGDDEGVTIMHMYADDQGDAWGRQDRVHFAYLPRDNCVHDESKWTEYTTTISLVNSHCEKFAKAGIMLRKETDDYPLGAGAYFSMMRTCDSVMRVQYRKRAYILTVAKLVSPNAIEGNSIEVTKRVGMKLRYRFDGDDSHVEGYSKVEGGPYVLVARETFRGIDLTEHGIFASSHYWHGNADGTTFQALFINTKRNNDTLTASNFTSLRAGQAGNMFGDGYNPTATAEAALLPETSSGNRGRRNHRHLRGDD